MISLTLEWDKYAMPDEFELFGLDAEMDKLLKLIPAISHIGGTHLGVSLYRWIDWNGTELDEILEDGGYDLIEPNTDTYEWMLAEGWSKHFERKLEVHWTRQAQARTPLGYEWVPNSVVNELRVAGGSVKVRKSENGQAEIAIWASTFMGKPDVAYNLAYFKAVAMGLTLPEAVKAADNARNRARTPYRRGWRPNEVVVNATLAGLVTSRNVIIRWQKAPAMIGQMTVRDKEGLLAAMRNVYRRANGERPHIAAVGKAIAGL